MMPFPTDDAEAASAWMQAERNKRGWSTTKLAQVAREIARREGSSVALTQQSVSGFEQPGKKRVPDWMRYVKMAFEEGEPPAQQAVQRRDELAYVRQVDISFAMGDGSEIEDYPETQLVPFNLNFLHSLSHASLDRLFLASGHGESMEPTLLRHDLVLIDTTQTRVAQQDNIWALTYAGAGMVKRLRRVRNEGRDEYLIVSDNPLVPPQPASIEDVHIVGRVIWVGRRMN